MDFESYEDYVKHFTENDTKFIQSITYDSEVYEIRDVGAHLRIDELEKELVKKRLRTYEISGIFIYILIPILILVTLVFVLSLAYTNLKSEADDLPQRNTYSESF